MQEKEQENSFETRSFFKGEEKKIIPLTVSAPVVIDTGSEEGVQPLLDFVSSLKFHGNKAVAEEESHRLAPYFSAMSVYLTRAIDALLPNKKDAGEFAGVAEKYKDSMKKITTPGGLSGIFNAMAACTRNTLISDVAVMPYSIKANKKASDLFDGWNDFNVDYNYSGHIFDFGFLQVCKDGTWAQDGNSITFPTLMIDNEMMADIAAHQPEQLLRDLQAVTTFVNHDMLHHFTSPAINAKIANKYVPAADTPINEWFRSLPIGGLYEEWAQIGQEKILLSPENAAQVEDVCKKLDHYFDELKRIGEEIREESYMGDAQDAHNIVDFFGMMMAHVLTRIFPLNHPVMAHCLDCLQQADPAPENALADCARMAEDWQDEYQSYDRGQLLKFIRKAIEDTGSDVEELIGSKKLSDIIQSYKNLSCDILPDNDSEVGYKNIKLLQLIRLSGEDIHPHTPQASYDTISIIQKAADMVSLNMISAAAKTAGLFKPK
jgi:hypothetical protein